MKREEYLRMQLAGTVTFPATFPQLGRLKVLEEKLPTESGETELFLVVSECPSTRVELTRRVPLRHVRAIFLPSDPGHVDYSEGTWIVGPEILEVGLQSDLDFGIAFVCEDAPSLLEVSVGMTAAESIQYYPPLPGDTSRNHYNPWTEDRDLCAFFRECC